MKFNNTERKASVSALVAFHSRRERNLLHLQPRQHSVEMVHVIVTHPPRSGSCAFHYHATGFPFKIEV